MREKLFLIHGWNMPSPIWDSFRQKLLEYSDVEIHVATMSGYELNGSPSGDLLGITDEPESTDSVIGRVIQDLLEQAPESAHWCGWSLGASLAISAAASHPDRVTGLTLISPTPRFLVGDDWDLGMDPRTFDKLQRITLRNHAIGWSRFLQMQFPRKLSQDQILQLEQQIKSNASGFCPTRQALEDGKRLLCDMDLRPCLEQISSPVHVIAGSDDQIIPVEASKFVSEKIAGASFVEVDAGHGLIHTNASEVAAIVAANLMSRSAEATQ